MIPDCFEIYFLVEGSPWPSETQDLNVLKDPNHSMIQISIEHEEHSHQDEDEFHVDDSFEPRASTKLHFYRSGPDQNGPALWWVHDAWMSHVKTSTEHKMRDLIDGLLVRKFTNSYPDLHKFLEDFCNKACTGPIQQIADQMDH